MTTYQETRKALRARARNSSIPACRERQGGYRKPAFNALHTLPQNGMKGLADARVRSSWLPFNEHAAVDLACTPLLALAPPWQPWRPITQDDIQQSRRVAPHGGQHLHRRIADQPIKPGTLPQQGGRPSTVTSRTWPAWPGCRDVRSRLARSRWRRSVLPASRQIPDSTPAHHRQPCECHR